MNLQYISDSNGKTTGVFIPINEWDELKTKFKGIDSEETSIPDWHKELVRDRMIVYKKNSGEVLDFDTALEDIEKEL